ncbi:hypothetical protein LTR16_011482, partial [Cryomyces antarcticus]
MTLPLPLPSVPACATCRTNSAFWAMTARVAGEERGEQRFGGAAGDAAGEEVGEERGEGG